MALASVRSLNGNFKVMSSPEKLSFRLWCEYLEVGEWYEDYILHNLV